MQYPSSFNPNYFMEIGGVRRRGSWTLVLGLALAVVSVAFARDAETAQVLAIASSHGGWCGLSGAGQVVLFGHCASCWAALAAGLMALVVAGKAAPARG